MKRFLISTTFVLVFAGMALAKGPGSRNGQGNSSGRAISQTFTGNNVVKLSTSQTQLTKKTTGISIGQNQFTKKFHGNSNGGNFQSFRTSLVKHNQHFGHYNVPSHCRQHCVQQCAPSPTDDNDDDAIDSVPASPGAAATPGSEPDDSDDSDDD